MTAALKNADRTPFSDYSSYIAGLNLLALEPHRAKKWNTRVEAALNGQASTELQRIAPLETRREFGAFFTGTDLSAKLIKHGRPFGTTDVFYDASSGMGDLLVSVAKKLPLRRTLEETLLQWGRQLTGTDLHSEFIEGARTRLVLLARQRHKSDEPLKLSHAKLFPNIRAGNGLSERALFRKATRLLLNPPFGMVAAPEGCGWAGGKITQAAEFVVTALERARPGTEILAILPDVLRSGSFTEHWRTRVGELADVQLVKPHGIFDESADVDVFLLRLVRSRKKPADRLHDWTPPAKTNGKTVGDFFEVHVGRVVPHRDKKAGPGIHTFTRAACLLGR